ncbi:MAG: [Fe-Fe] hydrogenase large subunit C-terminal domain-containing protein [Gemmatimonadaceae bacterium]
MPAVPENYARSPDLRHVRAPSASLPVSHPLSIAVIGNDMLLAAMPATPVQLAHACYQFGFEIVVPASWGDELVAQAVLEDVRHRDRAPVIQCTCPLVSERLLANGQHLSASMVQTAAPPVAAARYARHAFSPRALHVTYIGACPGARDAAIDLRLLPDEFTRMLNERDIVLADMPTVFDSVLPPDRRRFVSLPGGCPTQEALWQASDGRMLREVTQPTFSTDLAQTLVWREYVMVDVAPSLGCACAGGYSRLGTRCGRVAVTALEPPRASQSVVMYQPEFAAPMVDEPIVVPYTRNGDEPVEQAPERQEVARAASRPDLGPREAMSEQETPSRVRVRTPSSTLPRAYLAKRRQFGSPAKEPAPRVEVPAAEPAVESMHVPAAGMPNEDVQPTAAPNEPAQPFSSEPADVPLPIAVHVEPEATPPEEPVTQAPSPVAPSSEITVAAPLPAPPLPEIEEAPPAPAFEAQDAREEERWGPPVAVAEEEFSETFEPTGGPLRVEVEIYDASAPAVEIVVADAKREDEAQSAAPALPEVVAQPARTWGDVLIALWLVLVASAVIASLLWRR